jgi:hypothetical protein
MKWSNVFNLAVRLLLGSVLVVCLTAFVFDWIVISEVRRACKLHITDKGQRQAIDEVFDFRWYYVGRVREIYEKEHPALADLQVQDMNTSWINLCLLPRQWARVDLVVEYAPVFGKNGERLTGLDAACRNWFNHGIEQASPEELQTLHANLVSPGHPAMRMHRNIELQGSGI